MFQEELVEMCVLKTEKPIRFLNFVKSEVLNLLSNTGNSKRGIVNKMLVG